MKDWRYICLLVLSLTMVLSPGMGFPEEYRFPFSEGVSREKEGIAFGKVEVFINNESRIWSDSLFAASPLSTGIFVVFVWPEGSPETYGYRLASDGSFSWRLPPGRYVISGFRFGQVSIYGGRIFASFSIPNEGVCVYIGTLKISFRAGTYLSAVEDEYAKAMSTLKEPLPCNSKDISKSLLTLEVKR